MRCPAGVTAIARGALLLLVAVALLTALAPRAQAADCVVPNRLGVAFVLDDSGSMLDNDPSELRASAAGAGIDTLPDGSLVAASKFSDTASSLFDAAPLSAANRPALKQAIANGLVSEGGTDYDQAFTEANAQLAGMAGADKRGVVFLSDGEPNYAYSADRTIDAEGIPIFAVGFGDVGGAELSGIAQRSGGQAFSLRSASDIPGVFDRILSILNCDVQQGDVDLTVKPGQTRTFPFTVPRGQPGFHAFVSWARGALDVSLVRPDGSSLASGKTRPGESITASATSADATVTNPPAGRWKVRVHAPAAEVHGVRLHLDLWTREKPGTDTGEDPNGPPKPSGKAGCRYKLAVSSIQLEASCLTIEKNVAKMTGRIRVDGLDVTPDGNTTLSLDLKTLELKSSGEVTVTAGPLTLFHGKFDRKLATFSLPVPASVGAAVNKLKGLPIKGDASIDFSDGVAKVTLNAALPDFGNLTGSVTVSASNANGLQLSAASITLPEAKFKGIGLKDASLSYAKVAEGDQWSGQAKVELPSPTVQAVSGGATVLNGSFAEGHAAVDGNFPIAEAVFLTHVDANLMLHPTFAFGGGLGISAGPKVLGVRAVGIDGNFEYTSGAKPSDPDDYKISGDVKIADKLNLANGFVDYKTNGQATAGGEVKLEIGGFGFDGTVSGFASSSAFQIKGDGTVGYKGHGLGGEGIVSSKGLAGCAKVLWGRVSVGFSVAWSDFSHVHPFAGSCDLSKWEVQGASSALLAPGTIRRLRVRGHPRLLAIAATGVGAPPQITLIGPHHETITSPTVAQGLVTTPTEVGLAYPDDRTAYLVVGHPHAGRWRLRVDPGPAVSSLRRAGGLPAAKISGHVAGRGYRRTLTFRARRIAGQRIVFYERGNGVGRRIAATRRTHGRIHFAPADGPAGRRTVVASFEENGFVRATLPVARFRAPGARRPGRVRGLHIRRRGARAIITWPRAARAHAYDVHVHVSDGRSLLFTVRRRRLTIGRTRGRRVTVAVQAVSAAGREGRARSATLRVHHAQKHHRKRPKKHRRH